MSEMQKNLPWWNDDGVDVLEDEIPEITEEMLTNVNFYEGRKLLAKRRNGRTVLVAQKEIVRSQD